ncbi:MAG: hypothetical protein U0Q19_02800 [Kineosporiaceae bacterium]
MSRVTLIHYLAEVRERMSYSPTIMLAVLGCLLVALILAIGGSRWAAAALVPLAGAWLMANQLVEGPVLVVLSWRHGVTTADLLSLLALIVAAWRLWPPIVDLLDRPAR